MKYIFLFLICVTLSSCTNNRDVTEIKTVYDRVDHWWPKSDEFVPKQIPVVKDEYLPTIPYEPLEVFIKNNKNKYVKSTINILPSSYSEMIKKDKEETRAFLKKVFKYILILSIAVLILAAIAKYFNIAGSIDIIVISMTTAACSVASLYYIQYVIYICTIYAISLLIHFIYNSIKKDTIKKTAEELVITGETIKTFDKWGKEEKTKIKEIQSTSTSKFVERVQSKLKDIQNDLKRK